MVSPLQRDSELIYLDRSNLRSRSCTEKSLPADVQLDTHTSEPMRSRLEESRAAGGFFTARRLDLDNYSGLSRPPGGVVPFARDQITRLNLHKSLE